MHKRGKRLHVRPLQVEEAGQELASEMGAMRVRLLQLEGLFKSRDKEVAALQKQASVVPGGPFWRTLR